MRYMANALAKDLGRKAVILSGPRQCGKTYLSQHLFQDFDYLNFDVPEDRKRLLRREWFRDRELVVFDELHKMKKWKSWLKGVLDSTALKQKFLITGSAKLNAYKKVGDSLAGRYFSYRLYPFDLKEILALRDGGLSMAPSARSPSDVLERLLKSSGFPEPFLVDEHGYYARWQQTHLDVILKQDILETESVRSVQQLETLVLLLTEKVGSTLSYNSLREDLRTDDKSVKRWVDILENAYVLFRIHPYTTRSMLNAIRKAPKAYFMDYARVENQAARLENLVAFSILKEIHYRRDVKGEIYDLHYLKNKQQREIDFLITKNRVPHLMIEIKESDREVSENFSIFEKHLPKAGKIQLVKNLEREFLSRQGVRVVPLSQWLGLMDF